MTSRGPSPELMTTAKCSFRGDGAIEEAGMMVESVNRECATAGMNRMTAKVVTLRKQVGVNRMFNDAVWKDGMAVT